MSQTNEQPEPIPPAPLFLMIIEPAPPAPLFVTITTPYQAYFVLYGLGVVFAATGVWSATLELLDPRAINVGVLRYMCIAFMMVALWAGYSTLQRKLRQALVKSLCAQLPYRAARTNIRRTRFEGDIKTSGESTSKPNAVQYGRLERVGVGNGNDSDTGAWWQIHWRQTFLVTLIG